MDCCKSLQHTHTGTHTHARARTHTLTRTTHGHASHRAVFDGEAVLMVACGFSLAFLTAVVTEGGGVSPLGEGRTGSWGTRLHLVARGGRAAGCRPSRAGRRSRSPTRRGRRPRPRRRCGIRRLRSHHLGLPTPPVLRCHVEPVAKHFSSWEPAAALPAPRPFSLRPLSQVA